MLLSLELLVTVLAGSHTESRATSHDATVGQAEQDLGVDTMPDAATMLRRLRMMV
jgi:hypothetical protein